MKQNYKIQQQKKALKKKAKEKRAKQQMKYNFSFNDD